MTDNVEKAVKVEITGRVQGVGYRDWTAREARRRGLRGYVRNRTDGTVEAVFEGPADAIEAMIEACRSGPALARVDRLETAPVAAQFGNAFAVR